MELNEISAEVTGEAAGEAAETVDVNATFIHACKDNHLEEAKRIFSGDPPPSSSAQTQGYLAAVTNGHIAIAAWCLDQGTDVDSVHVMPSSSPFAPAVELTALPLAIESGSEQLVGLLIERGSSTTQVIGGHPMLALAVRHQQEVILRQLLAVSGSDPSVRDIRGFTPLHIAVSKSNGKAIFVEILIEAGADVNAADPEHRTTPLILACGHGSEEAVKLLLDHGADPALANADGDTALHMAGGSPAKTKLLLDSGRVNIDAANGDGTTALISAAQEGHTETVGLLVAAACDVNLCKDFTRTSALYMAAQGAHGRIVEILLAADAEVDAVSVTGATPFLIACQVGDVECFELLVAKGANIHHTDPAGVTPLFMAAQKNHLPLVKRLVELGARLEDPAHDGGTALFTACIEKNMDIVRFLIASGANVDALRSLSGFTPLLHAAQTGNLDVCQALLEAGADTSVQANRVLCTPLVMAASQGHTDIVEALLRFGADHSIAAVDGGTPLFLAAQKNHLSILKSLIEAGADANVENSAGGTPLFVAVVQGYVEAAKLLLAAGADCRRPGPGGRPLLATSVTSGNPDIVDLILAQDPDINQVDSRGISAFNLCLHVENEELALKLIEAGADLEPPTPNIPPPLYLAAKHSFTRVVEAMLAKGASVAPEITSPMHPIVGAVLSGSVDVVKEFLSRGASPDVRVAGSTLLGIAASDGFTPLLDILAGVGIDLNSPDDEGFSPLLQALKNSHAESALKLISLGADVNLCATDGSNRGPLYFACGEGMLDVFNALLAAGADANQYGALAASVEKAHLEMVDALLTGGANPKPDLPDGLQLLHLASKTSSLPVVARLLSIPDVDINCRTASGLTPLHVAAFADCDEADSIQIIEALLDAGADLNAVDDDDDPALHVAMSDGRLAVAASLIRRGAEAGGAFLIQGIRSSHLELVDAMLGTGLDVSQPIAENGMTLLHLAAQQSNPMIVTRLATAGVPLDAVITLPDGSELTAKEVAVGSDNLDVAMAFIIIEYGDDSETEENQD